MIESPRRLGAVLTVAFFLLAPGVLRAGDTERIDTVLTSEAQRLAYLASAVIWRVAPWGLTPRIVSGTSEDQGWSWVELANLIDMLPPGPLRERQEVHLDALTLLGVFLQHGDRKPEQHRLSCQPPVDTGAGVRQANRAAISAGARVRHGPAGGTGRTPTLRPRSVGRR